MASQSFVHLPIELTDCDPTLIRTYLVLVRIAHENNGREIYLPPRDARCKLYGVNHRRAIELERELERLNLIMVQSPGGDGFKNARRRIIIKYQVTTQNVVEVVEPKVAYRLPDAINALKRMCRNADTQRKTLADYTDQELYMLSGGASPEDIRTAIIEVEHFKPTNRQPIYSIRKAFASRFINGALDPNRKGKLREEKQTPPQPTEQPATLDSTERNYVLTAMEYGANLLPDNHNTVEQIDALAQALSCGEPVELGLPPRSLLRLVDRFPGAWFVDGGLYRLRAGYVLKKLASGYYRLIADAVTHEN